LEKGVDPVTIPTADARYRVEGVPENVLMICRTLARAGHQAWLVGGAVRDSLMGREPHDWDIATDARPDVVAGLFERVVATGIQHGTVTVVVGHEPFEVTTFRADGEYSDGRRPDGVTFLNTIEEDLARRDFTMNAMAWDPLAEKLCDPFGGWDDLFILGAIRAVGDPELRFREDGLRMLRAARFTATLGMYVAPPTLSAISDAIPLTVAAERVHDEWVKALSAPKPSVFLRTLQKSGLLARVAPEMLPMIGCEQNRYHAYDVWDHSLAVLDASPSSDIVVRVAAAFHDVSKPATKGVNEKTGDVTFYDHENVGAGVADGILERMRFSTDHRQRAVHLIRHHLIPYQPGWAAAAIRRWVRRVGAEHVAPLLQLGRADIAGKGQAAVEIRTDALDELERRIAEMEIRAPIVTNTAALAINGADVMTALGIPPGKRVGEVLRALLEAVTDEPDLNTRERLLDRLQVVA
jgi:tRNA nucleotidyltransferase (CCA-adding enzyme)